MWGEKPDFTAVSKFNTGSLPLCGILPVKKKISGILLLAEYTAHHTLSLICAFIPVHTFGI